MESNTLTNSSQTSNATDQETQQSTAEKRPRKPPKHTKSKFWEHCIKGARKLSDGTEQQIGICKYCKVEIPTVYGSTSGLKNHLVKRCKSSPLYEASENDKSQTILTNETMGQGSALVPHTFNQKRCELKVARYVIVDEVSFRTVEGNGFVELLHELQPRFKIPDRKKVAGMVYDIFLVEKAKIQSVIGDQRVSITTDTWTSIQNINYMVVTAHFLKRRMKSENSLLFEGKYLHLRCACHIINLIVKDGLKELHGSIKAIRNAVVFIHSSPSRLNKFREFAMLAKFSSTSTVPMDVKTRWNATYKMLEGALKYRRVFERMAEEWLPFVNYFHEKDDKGKERIGPPIADDWEMAKAFVHFLKKFYDATLELSASKTPTSQLIYQSMIALQIEIDRKRLDSDPILKEVACAMKLKFDKYWGNWNGINPLIFIGNILDPRNKLQMVKVTVRKLGGTPTSIKEFVDRVKQNLVTLWTEYKRMNDVLNAESQNMQIECDDGYEDTSGGKEGLCDELFDDVEAQNEEEQLQEISNEVDKYLADEIEKRSNQSFNLLEWWKGSETRYPILSMIAKDIFSIPCSTVASESAFSLGKRVVDPFRSSLSPKMVEALVCTSDWLRAEEFSFWKDPTDDDLELYKEIEEIEKTAGATQDCANTSSSPSTLV